MSEDNCNTYTAILIRASESKDFDKKVHLFTLEKGMINATMKGVKRQKAKLKFGAEPFSFCQYETVTKNGYHTVIGCSPIEDLFGLTQDPDKYLIGCVMLEVSERAASSLESPELFILLLKCLKALLYCEKSSENILAYFVLHCLKLSGYGKEYDKFEFPDILTQYLIGLEKSSEENLPLFDKEIIKKAVRILLSDFENRHDCVLKSKKFII